MKTVGEILRLRRLQKDLKAADIARLIMVKEQFIIAIENNNFTVFPDEVFAQGHVKNYAEVLGINPDEILPFFRRTWELTRKNIPVKVQENNIKDKMFFNRQIEKVGRNISGIMIAVGTIIILISFVVFLIMEYQRNIVKPELRIIYPAQDTRVSSHTVVIKGETDKENKIYINDEEAETDNRGFFSFKVSLDKGINKFIISAVNKNKKVTTTERLIDRK